MIVENETLKTRLEKKKYDEVYRDNELLQLELKNMYILQEENNDLREELNNLKSLTYEERMKAMVEENKLLKERNGYLLIQVSELEKKVEDLQHKSIKDELVQSSHMARP